MQKLDQLNALGQSIWLDFIRRSFLTSGDLKNLVARGIQGVTSNPSIFEKAIARSDDYDEQFGVLVNEGLSVNEIYEQLAFKDIRMAADILRPVYDRTNGADGYVSLEVSPTLAHDTPGTLAEAERLFTTLGQPNVMIKIPATEAGYPAIEAAIGRGININVTLIFSIAQYEAVVEAYLHGLERLAQTTHDLSRVASVASFFVSRVDTMVDQALAEVEGGEALMGKIAVANACAAYARFKELFSGARWDALVEKGARLQRPLWASTSTKNPAYSDTLYVDNLIGAHTVNTLPPATLEAFLDHGQVAETLEHGCEQARETLSALAKTGIDLDSITGRLLDDGVKAFARSFQQLVESIEMKGNGAHEEG